MLAEQTRQTIATYVACGIDPEESGEDSFLIEHPSLSWIFYFKNDDFFPLKMADFGAVVFVQSHVRQHSELQWLLSWCVFRLIYTVFGEWFGSILRTARHRSAGWPVWPSTKTKRGLVWVKMRNSVLKTRNFVSKMRNFMLKMRNFAGHHSAVWW